MKEPTTAAAEASTFIEIPIFDLLFGARARARIELECFFFLNEYLLLVDHIIKY